MTGQNHNEPCKTLHELSKEVAEAKTGVVFTREWVQAISDTMQKNLDCIRRLELTMERQLSDFNARLITKTSVVTGSAAAGIVTLVEVARYFLAK